MPARVVKRGQCRLSWMTGTPPIAARLMPSCRVIDARSRRLVASLPTQDRAGGAGEQDGGPLFGVSGEITDLEATPPAPGELAVSLQRHRIRRYE